MTDLEKGILVYIDSFEFNTLKNKSGFLPVVAYPPEYEKNVLPNELGRFLMFRFLKKDNCIGY